MTLLFLPHRYVKNQSVVASHKAERLSDDLLFMTSCEYEISVNIEENISSKYSRLH